MTRLFVDGKHTPVTALKVAESTLVQVKTTEKDGYNAIQIGSIVQKNASKAEIGHIKAHAGIDRGGFRFLTEFRTNEPYTNDKKMFDINDISQNDELCVSGVSVGTGFTGAIKRYGFRGQPASHGHDHVRAVGSIGARWPQRTLKGKKMAGRDGGKQITINNVKVIAIDPENKLIFVNGSVPGANSSYLRINTMYTK